VLTLAEIFNAYVVFAEHRYYGESMPFGQQSFATRNVGHLSVENALADYARLILHLKANVTDLKDSPVVVFGGSYGGSLAAYMRMSYPDIVDISLAASSPVLLYDGVTGSNEFFNVVRDDFARIDHRCPDVIKAGLLQVAKSSQTDVQSAMNLCQPMSAQMVC
jgi:pimeloyl-ACP methyl ester carboxylesterase